jgi:hypothetical protein
VHFFSAHFFAAEVAWFSGVSTYARYPCLRAAANSAVDEAPSQAIAISFTPSALAGGIAAWFHCTKTVLHADEEKMTQTHNTNTFLKLMRSVPEP